MPDYVAMGGDWAVVAEERLCRTCAHAQERLAEGIAPGPDGGAAWQVWPAGWWCGKHRRPTSETGSCEDWRPGGPGEPKVMRASY